MTKKVSKIHHRRSIRLNGYDYSLAGGYFVTICVRAGECLLGDVVEHAMVLNELGQIVEEEWQKTGNLRDYVDLDVYVMMPNHLHGIVWLTNEPAVGAMRASPPSVQRDQPRGPQSTSLGAVIGGFKSAATRRINKSRGTPGAPFWLRNYYEHIIRNERSLKAIRAYIINNPVNWRMDQLHPENPKGARLLE